jgi:hypothetical protein
VAAGCCAAVGDLPAGPGVSATGRQLCVEGFVALWRGERLSVADLADDTATVQALVDAGRLELDDQGVVVGAHGLTARPTAHRIQHADGVVHTWCAFDAIGIRGAGDRRGRGYDMPGVWRSSASHARFRGTGQ